MQGRITKSFTFDAAHRLSRVPADHPCHRIHGHTYNVKLGLEGTIDAQYGWVMDFREIKEAFLPLRQQLDHSYLNEIEGLENPTAENVARWIAQRLKPSLPLLTDVLVAETPTSETIYRT